MTSGNWGILRANDCKLSAMHKHSHRKFLNQVDFIVSNTYIAFHRLIWLMAIYADTTHVVLYYFSLTRGFQVNILSEKLTFKMKFWT